MQQKLASRDRLIAGLAYQKLIYPSSSWRLATPAAGRAHAGHAHDLRDRSIGSVLAAAFALRTAQCQHVPARRRPAAYLPAMEVSPSVTLLNTDTNHKKHYEARFSKLKQTHDPLAFDSKRTFVRVTKLSSFVVRAEKLGYWIFTFQCLPERQLCVWCKMILVDIILKSVLLCCVVIKCLTIFIDLCFI